jgi:hypothetical protein
MAYTTGSAVSFSALHTALKDACVASGWAWDAGEEVLSKGTMFVKLSVTTTPYSGGLTALGRTSLTTGNGPNLVQIGAMLGVPLTFPVTYHCFTFTNEIFFIISYGAEYQYLTFGQSTQPGLAGTGCYYSGSLSASIQTIVGREPGVYLLGGGSYYTTINYPAFGWSTFFSSEQPKNTFIHSDLDGDGWRLDNGLIGEFYEDDAVGRYYAYDLLKTQPNTYNMESVLIPYRLIKVRPNNLFSQVMEAENCRHIRTDYYPDESILTIGLDKWMVFPHFKRNLAARDGGAGHSGTLGWAIKYEGP